MDENSNQPVPTETEFQDAFATAMADPADTKPPVPVVPVPAPVEAPKAPEAAPVVVDKPAEGEKPKEGEPQTPVAGDEKTDEEKQKELDEAEAEKVKTETAEETADRHAKEAADKAAENEPKPLTKDDIGAAIREDRDSITKRIDNVHQARDEIITKLHPEGIDQKVYDTNGNVIKTAQDIVDRGLVNEATKEPYTYEEAASFMLRAGEQMAKNVEELNDWAEKVAEKNINLAESSQRVMAKYADVFKTLPKETVQMLADTYTTKQLKFSEDQSYILEMNMTPEEYYDVVMAPYSTLTRSIEAEKTTAEKEAADKAKSEQEERNGGIPPQRGSAQIKANTGNEFTDALLDELAKP